MIGVKTVRVLEGSRLHVEFADGLAGEVELADRLFGPMFEPLREPGLFAQAAVDEFRAICWPNGADLAADALYRRVAGRASPTAGSSCVPRRRYHALGRDSARVWRSPASF